MAGTSRKKKARGRPRLPPNKKKAPKTLAILPADHELFERAVEEMEDVDTVGEFLIAAGRKLAEEVLANEFSDPTTEALKKLERAVERLRLQQKELLAQESFAS